MSTFDYFNGQFIPTGTPVITADSRALRYGDGLFETIKVINGQLLLSGLHFSRLFNGMELLGFEIPKHFTPESITEIILQLCRKNKAGRAARVRLSVLRGNGGPYDPETMQPRLLIQCWPLPEHLMELNQNGLQADIYSDARKSCDAFSHLKSNNYLPYLMGAQFARKHQLNEAILLNVYDRICDATIANIAWIKNGTIFTPPLSEGCVGGVMRAYLLQNCEAITGHSMTEQAGTTADLAEADELFLTNAISGIRWVAQCGSRQYGNQLVTLLYKQLISPMNAQ